MRPPSADPQSETLAEGPALHGNTEHEIHGCDPATADDRRKAVAKLQAVLALAGGFVLHTLADGGFLVARWGLTRSFETIEEVRSFARQVGAE